MAERPTGVLMLLFVPSSFEDFDGYLTTRTVWATCSQASSWLSALGRLHSLSVARCWCSYSAHPHERTCSASRLKSA